MRDDRMLAAVAEETRKLLRSGHPEAVKAVHAGVRNPEHKDHARFVAMVLDRSDPVESAAVSSRSRTGPSIQIRRRLRNYGRCASSARRGRS